MAQGEPDRLALVERGPDAERVVLRIPGAPQLDASTAAPAGFVWDTVAAEPGAVPGADMISGLRQHHVAYPPADRDRLEIRVYAGEIAPARVATGAGYAVLLASAWGPLNFGLRAHGRDFGEVLGGDESLGTMRVSRISVWRRGTSILVMRALFDPEHYDAHAETMAALAGSLRFEGEAPPDPVEAAFAAERLEVGAGLPALRLRLPGNWEALSRGSAVPGDAATWIDAADPGRDAGALLVAMPPPQAVPAGGLAPIPPEAEQPLVELSAELVRAAMANMLPEARFALEPQEMNANAAFDGIAAFNRTFVYSVPTEAGPALVATVLLTQTLDGATLGSVTLAPAASTPRLLGTQLHVGFANALLLEDMEAYARAAARGLGR